jgi:hypothetical protein
LRGFEHHKDQDTDRAKDADLVEDAQPEVAFIEDAARARRISRPVQP